MGLIAAGPTSQQYEMEKKRFNKVKPLIDTYQGCNAAQKRLILYAVLHKMLYTGKDTVGGQRDPMPECIKDAVRRQCPDEGALSEVGGGVQGGISQQVKPESAGQRGSECVNERRVGGTVYGRR